MDDIIFIGIAFIFIFGSIASSLRTIAKSHQQESRK